MQCTGNDRLEESLPHSTPPVTARLQSWKQWALRTRSVRGTGTSTVQSAEPRHTREQPVRVRAWVSAFRYK